MIKKIMKRIAKALNELRIAFLEGFKKGNSKKSS